MAEQNILEAIRTAMDEEMERDDRVMVLGEDVGRKGGVFGATEGLWAKYGDKRVLDTPLTEGMIAGAAMGAAVYGLRPIAAVGERADERQAGETEAVIDRQVRAAVAGLDRTAQPAGDDGQTDRPCSAFHGKPSPSVVNRREAHLNPGDAAMTSTFRAEVKDFPGVR